MSSRLSSERIKAEAKDLGFFACGIAKAERVDTDAETELAEWLGKGMNADMAYMANHTDKRLDPRLLMDGLKSIICVAMNYAPACRMPKDELQFAAYALGQDYHFIVKERLRLLAGRLGLHSYRVFCDSAPVLERYWAAKAGLGWIGRNRQLIIPHAGSMFFLGELFTDKETDYDLPVKNRCGNCRSCIDACPTGALAGTVSNTCKNGDLPHEAAFDARLCLSYQTIENRGEIPPGIAMKMGNTVYGCDRCQQACPWNRFATPSEEPLLRPRDELLSMTRDKWNRLTPEDYRRLFKGSAVKRVKYEGLMRNISAVNNNLKEKNKDNGTGE